MARYEQEREINGAGFKYQQLGATASTKLFARLAGAIGPALGAVFDGLKAGDGKINLRELLDKPISGDVFSKASAMLFDRLDEDAVLYVVDILKEQSYYRGQKGWVPLKDVFELVFRGNMRGLLGWLRFALEAEYADFFAFAPSPEHQGSGETKNDQAG